MVLTQQRTRLKNRIGSTLSKYGCSGSWASDPHGNRAHPGVGAAAAEPYREESKRLRARPFDSSRLFELFAREEEERRSKHDKHHHRQPVLLRQATQNLWADAEQSRAKNAGIFEHLDDDAQQSEDAAGGSEKGTPVRGRFIARRPDGELWLSRNWTGEDSYILGLAKYMAGPGPERVRYTCQQYKLRDTIHVDVLSYFPLRNDWDPAHPASGIKNLFEGRFQVLDEFKKQGLDVSSEAMRYAFVGKISMFWHMAQPKACPFGGKSVPLQPLVYRKSAIWGEAGSSPTLAGRLLRLLFYNSAAHLIMRSDTDRREITDLFYLMILPWHKVHALNIEAFRREGDRTLIVLEGNSHIDLDWSAKTYSVVLDGVEIARDLGTFCPLDDGRIAFYAVAERELSAPLPGGWNPASIATFALSAGKAEEINATVEGGRVKLAVPARRPVLVYRDGAAARERLLQS